MKKQQSKLFRAKRKENQAKQQVLKARERIQNMIKAGQIKL